jgi:zinc/manganese transport system permease protein
MTDAIAFLILPFAAATVLVLIHAYFGVHVLRRRVVFADLALAQLAALGGTLAFANGYAAGTPQAFGYALALTAVGAALLTTTRTLSRHISQEAFVGIVYVLAMAATVLVIDRSPQGAEHVKRMLVGNILLVDGGELVKLGVALRRHRCAALDRSSPAVRLRRPPRACTGHLGAALRDFVFYLSFGVVVTSSVTVAGVLLVFSILIVPAVIGLLFSSRMSAVLAIAWLAGIVASAAGLVGSYALDLPSGAAIVCALGIALVLAGGIRALSAGPSAERRTRLLAAARGAVATALFVVLGSALWLIARPSADQPVLALVERLAGVHPAEFLAASERATFRDSESDALRFTNEIERLNAREKEARYAAAPLSDDDVRRIASYQRSFAEMVRGERFVQDVLRAKARARERWLIGLPAAVLALLGLAVLVRAPRPVQQRYATLRAPRRSAPG